MNPRLVGVAACALLALVGAACGSDAEGELTATVRPATANVEPGGAPRLVVGQFEGEGFVPQPENCDETAGEIYDIDVNDLRQHTRLEALREFVVSEDLPETGYLRVTGLGPGRTAYIWYGPDGDVRLLIEMGDFAPDGDAAAWAVGRTRQCSPLVDE